MKNVVINEICLFIIDKCEVMNNGNFEILSKMIVDDVKRIQSKLSQHDVIKNEVAVCGKCKVPSTGLDVGVGKCLNCDKEL